jgi:hypothetical protein
MRIVRSPFNESCFKTYPQWITVCLRISRKKESIFRAKGGDYDVGSVWLQRDKLEAVFLISIRFPESFVDVTAKREKCERTGSLGPNTPFHAMSIRGQLAYMQCFPAKRLQWRTIPGERTVLLL